MSKRTLLALLIALAALVPAWGADAPPRHDFPRVGPYQVLSGDFHMHTANSDGSLTTRERVTDCYNHGRDVIAVTDHGKTRAYRVAKYAAEPLEMVVIRGLETGIAKQEHMNAIGVSADYKPRNPHNWAEEPGKAAVFYQDQMRAIAASGGIIIYNHPHVGYREPVKWGVEQRLIIGIEVKNWVVGKGWNAGELNGVPCYPAAFDYALEHNLTLFANSDAHGPLPDNPPVTLVFAAEKSAAGVMEAIRARRTVAWFDGMLWGRKDLLTDLVGKCLALSSSGGRDSASPVTLTNLSPVHLKGTLDSCVIDLPPYQAMSLKDLCPGDKLVLKWQNVWINPRENLTTTLRVPFPSAAAK